MLWITAVLPLFPVDWWWVRIGDFPRLQLLASYVICAVAILPFAKAPFGKLAMFLLLMAISIQVYWIAPYLPIAPNQVQWSESDNPDSHIKIMTANVLQENQDSNRLLNLIAQQSPDVVVLCEVNKRWIADLASLEESFRHHTIHPLENKYGIALYSNLDIVSAEIRAMVKETIPSIDANIQLRNGQVIRLFAIHPNPPRPGEDTTKRDAELVLVGREIGEDETAIVLGDLNDVGWSRTTNLFQEVSGLLDPRRGRGFYPTFDAKSWIWRYPLDYVFHSQDFRVVEMETLTDIGSDHFPLLIVLSHEPNAALTQEAPDLDAGDLEDANDQVEALAEPDSLAEPASP